METYHLSRTTVRSALALLEREKYVVKQPGIGCIVLSSSEKEKSEKLRIGISLSTVSDQTYQTLLYEELMRAGERSNIDFIVRKNSELILGEGIDGAIFTTVTVSELKQMENDYRRKCPVVFINRMPVHPQFAYFAVDYENTSRRLVSRLLKNGAERVAMIGGADYLAGKYFADYTRSQGWRAAYREHAGHVPEELLFRTEELYADLNLACRQNRKGTAAGSVCFMQQSAVSALCDSETVEHYRRKRCQYCMFRQCGKDCGKHEDSDFIYPHAVC